MELQKPSPIDRNFNRVVGLIAGSRFAPGDLFLLVFYGRKTGNRYTTPVFKMRLAECNYLVAPRGETQWVKNVRKLNTLTLKRGKNEDEYQAIEITGEGKAKILQDYFERYKRTVTAFFPKGIGAEVSEFEKISQDYPVFELK